MKYFFSFLLLIGAYKSYSQTTTNARLDAIVKTYTGKGFSGAVLVADKGRITYQQYAGLANQSFGIPVTAQSKFRIASITKTFTAAIILKLMEQGKIDLTKTIGTYYPEYSGPARDSVTIHQLLTYSSGIQNIDQHSEEMYVLQMPVDTIIKKYCSGPLVTKPGTRIDYKNAEYIILGKIIEKITGKPYEKVLQDMILQPLKMTNASYLHNGDIIPNLVSSYLKDSSGTLHNDDPFWIENFYSSAAMYATATDLLTFDQALFTNKLLKKETMDLMTTSYPQLWGVAYSFWVNEQTFGKTKKRVMDRQGSVSGNNAAWYHSIDDNKTIIVLSNINAVDVTELREKLAQATF
jgi:CubicO group peptidase (beta-lactamase class C family)